MNNACYVWDVWYETLLPGQMFDPRLDHCERRPSLPPNFNCMILGQFSRLMMPLKAISWLSSLCLHPDSCCATRPPQKHPLACLLVFSSDALVRARWRISLQKITNEKIGCIRNILYWSDTIGLQQFSRDEALKKQEAHTTGVEALLMFVAVVWDSVQYVLLAVESQQIDTNGRKKSLFKGFYSLQPFVICGLNKSLWK